MIEERKAEELIDDRNKWKIYFDLEIPNAGLSINNRGDSSVLVKFTINRKENNRLSNEDIEKLKNDLKDLGKFRIVKQGKELLEK
ncbi:MAG: hypothetical protein AABX12_01815 [Nanoarchaeota archaeon]